MDLPSFFNMANTADGSGNGFFSSVDFADPQKMALLGFISKLMQASAPSRMPVSTGAALGAGFEGAVQGAGQGAAMKRSNQQSKLYEQETQKNELSNQMATQRMAFLKKLYPGLFGGDPNAPGGVGGAPAGQAQPQISDADKSAMALAPQEGDRAGGGPTPQAAQRLGMINDATAQAPASGTGGGTGNSDQDIAMRAMGMDFLVPGAGKEIVGKSIAGPTALQNLINERQKRAAANPQDPWVAIYDSAIAKEAGKQLMGARQGEAIYDPMKDNGPGKPKGGQVFQNPVLGPGLRLNPTDDETVEVVPDYLKAHGQIQRQTEGIQSEFAFEKRYDKAGNEYYVRKSDALAPSAPAAPGPRVGTPAPAPTAAAPALPAPGAAPAAPALPAAPAPAAKNPLEKATLDDVLGPAFNPPGLPDLPPGGQRGAPNPAFSKLQEHDAERLTKYQTSAAEGQKIYLDLAQLSDVMSRGLNTSNLQAFTTPVANIAQSLGVPIPKGFDPTDAAVMDKVTTDMTFAGAKQMGGKILVSEIEGLQRANPGKTLPRAANLEIMNSILSQRKWEDQRAKLATEYFTKYPGSLGTFDAAYNKAYPLVDVNKAITDAARKAGWRIPGDKKAGTTAPQKQVNGLGQPTMEWNPDSGLELVK